MILDRVLKTGVVSNCVPLILLILQAQPHVRSHLELNLNYLNIIRCSWTLLFCKIGQKIFLLGRTFIISRKWAARPIILNPVFPVKFSHYSFYLIFRPVNVSPLNRFCVYQGTTHLHFWWLDLNQIMLRLRIQVLIVIFDPLQKVLFA